MSGPSVLIVDSDAAYRRILRSGLSALGFAPKVVVSGEAALKEIEAVRPDVVLLDLQLHDIGGMEACRRIRTRWSVPIIVLSDTDDERTTVEALESGADDFVTRPLRVNELAARIRVALRRVLAPQRGGAPVFRTGDLVIDAGRRRVTLSDTVIHVSPTEYELLRYLAAYAGRLVTYPMLMKALWGDPERRSRHALRCAVAQLRRKLGESADAPRYLLTEPSVGFRLAVDGDAGVKNPPAVRPTMNAYVAA